MGVYTRKNPKGVTIALEAWRKDPEANPLMTPTGKVEIYSRPSRRSPTPGISARRI